MGRFGRTFFNPHVTAHNTSMKNQGITDFLEYLGTVAELETTIDNSSRAGLSISYKRR